MQSRFSQRTVPNAVVNLVFERGVSPMAAWREHLGLTQAAVAERVGITQAAYAQMERVKRPRKATLEKVASGLGAGCRATSLVAVQDVIERFKAQISFCRRYTPPR
jgi:transcriptional regulator with XRE-family HTH domain